MKLFIEVLTAVSEVILANNCTSRVPSVMFPEVLQQSYRRRRSLNIVVIFSLLCATWLYVRMTPHPRSLSYAEAPRAPTLQRIAKVSMLYGKHNHLYERALRSHQRHAERWGYRSHILRQDITAGFWNKPTYLLGLVIQELAKPPQDRLEWLVWVDADTIILNPAIPLEIFIPPSDLENVHIVASKDHNGLNTGTLFLHIHPWTVSMLIETIGHPLYLPAIDLGRSADQESMAHVLKKSTDGPTGKGYQDGLIYLPRPWVNAYEFAHGYEGEPGNLLVHFPGMNEDRWPHMSKWLHIIETTPHEWEVPLAKTDYLDKTTAFWTQVRDAKDTIESMRKTLQSMPNSTEHDAQARNDTSSAIDDLQSGLHSNADNVTMIQERLERLRVLQRSHEPTMLKYR